MLRSRQLAETVVENLGLVERWSGLDRSGAIWRLQENLSVTTTERDNLVTLAFRDPDPVLARDVAAAYVADYEDMASALNITGADQAAAVARERLDEVEAQLAAAEAELVAFRERYGIIDLPQQLAALVAAHAALTDRIRALGVELQGKRTYLTDRDPEVRDLLSRLAELERQWEALEAAGTLGPAVTMGATISSAPVDTLHAETQFSFGLHQVRALSAELERLEREVNLHREMYERLRHQYEAARLEASRKLNIVRLIDPPVVPDRPLPRRLLLNVVLAAFVGAFLAVMFAFVAEFLRTHAHDDRAVEELPFLALFRNKRHDGNGLLAPSRGAAARK